MREVPVRGFGEESPHGLDFGFAVLVCDFFCEVGDGEGVDAELGV